MRKLFSLCAAVLVALAVNASTETISPSSEESDSNIRSALSGSADTIILNAGNYKEADQIHFKRNAVIMAAEGADVTITPKYYCDYILGAKVTIIGIKFDGSVSSQQAIRVYDASAGKELRLENCEFKNFAKDVISCDNSEYQMDSCIINNCYFHNNNYSAIYFNKSSVENQNTIKGLMVTNSTFANNDPSKEYRALIDVQTYNREATDAVEVLIDHCTFYNNTVMNYDYSAIRTRIANNTSVFNCIFAHPSEQEWYATNVWAGEVANCLAHNLSKGYMSGPIRTSCNTGDPQFADAANGDFTLAETSPAIDAGTDGKTLGDPRWWPVIVYPETDFSTPYVCAPAKAKLSGRVSLKEDSLLWDNNAEAAANGVAKWKIHATKGCFITATINNASNNGGGHCWQVAILDADGNPVGDPVAEAETTWSHKDDLLSGTLLIPEAGDYTIKLSNSTAWSPAKLMGVTLTYSADPKTLYCYVDKAWWKDGGAMVNCYAKVHEGPDNTWPGAAMTEVEPNLWKVVIPSTYNRINFVRVNPANRSEYWGAKTDELVVPTNSNLYTITSDAAQWDSEGHTAQGSWSVKDAKFLIAGSMTNWDKDPIGSFEDSYTLHLAAGKHQMKVVDNGSWKGIGNLTEIAAGIYIDQDNNICFVLDAAADVTVNYKSGELFSLAGDFAAPSVQLIGIKGWEASTDAIDMTPALDKKSASVNLNLTGEWYEFKVIRGGELLGKENEGEKNYTITSDWTWVDCLVRDYTGLKSISLQPNLAGDYTFTWTYATGKLDVTFPVPAAIDNTEAVENVVKTFENGQLIIIKNGVKYNAQGAVVR